nr:DNA glycosylase [Methanobacterium aggregans]
MQKTLRIHPNGPFDLKLTIQSGQTSQPPWKFVNGEFQELLMIQGKPCFIGIHQKPDDLDGPLTLRAESKYEIEDDEIRSKVCEIFDLEHDLMELYSFLESSEKLQPTIGFCRGLRLFKAQDPFECIISSICSANNSIARWNKSILQIKEKWGDEFDFASGEFHSFPSPETLMKVPEHDIEEMELCGCIGEPSDYKENLKSCGVGYRCSYMKEAARMAHEEIDITKLGDMDYDNAFNEVLKFPGVGPKVADCILFYGYGMGQAFPVDVWIGRIISALYFKREEIKPPKARTFGMEEFGEHAGYVQLYLFHYARKSGLLESLKKK